MLFSLSYNYFYMYLHASTIIHSIIIIRGDEYGQEKNKYAVAGNYCNSAAAAGCLSCAKWRQKTFLDKHHFMYLFLDSRRITCFMGRIGLVEYWPSSLLYLDL